MVASVRPLLVSLVVLVLAPVLAGCISDPPTTCAPPSEPTPLAAPRNIWDECACWEATVAVAPDGTLYATNGWGSRILVERPGEEIASFPAPRADIAPFLGALPADVMLQVDADGRLHYHALLYHVENNPAYQFFMLLGIHVAISEDGGATWPVNTYISVPDSQQAPQLGADRQWMAIAPDGTLYMVYQRIPALLSTAVLGIPVYEHYRLAESDVMFSRSDDGGRTWSPFRALTESPSGVINGQPQVSAAGRLYVPYFAYGADAALHVAVSDDRGDTFRTRTIHADPMPGYWFPSLALLDEDKLIATWVGMNDTLRLARSDDAGATWSAPLNWTTVDEVIRTSPWTLVANDTLHVLWFRGESEASTSLWWSAAPIDDLDMPEHRVIDPLVNGTETKAAMTDFAHGVLGPAGELHTVWSDVDDPKLWHWAQPLA